MKSVKIERKKKLLSCEYASNMLIFAHFNSRNNQWNIKDYHRVAHVPLKLTTHKNT